MTDEQRTFRIGEPRPDVPNHLWLHPNSGMMFDSVTHKHWQLIDDKWVEVLPVVLHEPNEQAERDRLFRWDEIWTFVQREADRRRSAVLETIAIEFGDDLADNQ